MGEKIQKRMEQSHIKNDTWEKSTNRDGRLAEGQKGLGTPRKRRNDLLLAETG